MNNFQILFLLGCFAAASAQAANNSILCFVCNPTTTGNNCSHPASNLTPINCTAQNASRASCYSEFLNYNNVNGNTAWNNLTGIHRGCTDFNSTVDHCVRPIGVNVTRLSCQTCNASRCNTHTFNGSGVITGPGTGDTGGGGVVEINIFLSILIITLGLLISSVKDGI